VFLVVGIRNDLKKLRIAVDTTTVFRRTPTFTGDTTRVLAAVVGWLEPLMYENVLPVVADVIRVLRRWSVPVPLIEELRQGHLPPRHDRTVFRIGSSSVGIPMETTCCSAASSSRKS
jgi:hypothetical protein